MFVFKSIYCRIFQGAFRLALPILPYREPEIINSLEYLSKILQSKKLNSVLIVTDKGIIKNCLVAPLEAALTEQNINYVIYDGTMPNPTIRCFGPFRNIFTSTTPYCYYRNGRPYPRC